LGLSALARKTCRSRARAREIDRRELGIAPHIADKVLNHQSGVISGVAAVYNRFQYLDERKAALHALGRHIEKLIGRGPDNVVPLRQPA
jgi:hypothetical protein